MLQVPGLAFGHEHLVTNYFLLCYLAVLSCWCCSAIFDAVFDVRLGSCSVEGEMLEHPNSEIRLLYFSLSFAFIGFSNAAILFCVI